VFINNVISFLIVAFVLFMVIKAMNQLRRKQEEEPAKEPPPSREVQLLQEIRDALVAGGSGRPRAAGQPIRKPKAQRGFCAGDGSHDGAVARTAIFRRNFYFQRSVETILRLFAGYALLGE